MKKQLTIILVILSTMVMGQGTKLIFVQSLNFKKNIQTFQVEVTKKKGLGFFVSGGANILESLIGLDNHSNITSESNISGQTWWYTNPQNHVGLDMTDYNQNGLWSSPQYNNEFIEQTTYRATVNSAFTDVEVRHKLINIGFVFPYKNKVLKIGGGVYNNSQNGTSTNITTSTVKKVNLYWETNLQSHHIIYTQNLISEKVENTPIEVNKNVLNVHLSLQLNEFFTIGYDSQVGVNFGMIYSL